MNHAVSPLHRVWRFGDDVDTDALAPGAWMQHGIDVIARHCLESLRPEFAASVQAGDVIVAGANFGIGSSREQAAAALRHLGVSAVIAPSFAGLFFRNAFNLGLLLITCAGARQIAEGERVAFDAHASLLVREGGSVLPTEPIPAFLLDMVEAGGLLPQLEQRFQARSSP
jgi:3-isopropylmalate/(R)-2-methylmalate dehydratase small subunit